MGSKGSISIAFRLISNGPLLHIIHGCLVRRLGFRLRLLRLGLRRGGLSWSSLSGSGITGSGLGRSGLSWSGAPPVTVSLSTTPNARGPWFSEKYSLCTFLGVPLSLLLLGHPFLPLLLPLFDGANGFLRQFERLVPLDCHGNVPRWWKLARG